MTADLDAFRVFYEDVIGFHTAVAQGAGPGHGRVAVMFAGDVMLHVFEVPGYHPAGHELASPMFERGRIDHFGFTVSYEEALAELRDRLVAVGASGAVISPLAPLLLVRCQDPEGLEGGISYSYPPASTLQDAGPGRSCGPGPR